MHVCLLHGQAAEKAAAIEVMRAVEQLSSGGASGGGGEASSSSAVDVDAPESLSVPSNLGGSEMSWG
jgi:hypothetical protein